MNVFLYAPLEARIEHMCKDYQLSWTEADKLIKSVITIISMLQAKTAVTAITNI